MVLALSGAKTATRTENLAPCSLYGDQVEDGARVLNTASLPAGAYTLTATAYAERGGRGAALGTRTVTFTAEETSAPVTPPAVIAGFVPLDARDQSAVATLAHGASVDLEGRSGGHFAIRADVGAGATVGSVVLALSGAKTVSRTESLAPYSIYGDDMQGTLHGGTLPAGTYALSATAHAECRATGSVLGTLSVSFEVLAPAALSVADACAEEGTDATLDFAVTLDRSSTGMVTVDYAAADATATAGSDYTASAGTLAFSPGEREKTISVAVLEDAWDEGEETMTLRLSNVSGANIADGEATGTITNSDPIQKMWLARFGRTVGSQVVDAVAERLGGPLTSAQVTLAGQGVDLARIDDETALAEALSGLARAFGAEPAREADPEDGRSGSGGWSGSGFGAREHPGSGASQRAMSGREVLLGSAFHLSRRAEDGGPGFAAWGRVASGGFDVEEAHEKGAVRMDGEVTTGILGADAAWERWLAGLAVSVSEGEGTYAYGDVGSGRLESSLTGVHPYARLQVSERVQAWGLLGFGAGEMAMRPEGEDPIETDLDMRLGAVGARARRARRLRGASGARGRGGLRPSGARRLHRHALWGTRALRQRAGLARRLAPHSGTSRARPRARGRGSVGRARERRRETRARGDASRVGSLVGGPAKPPAKAFAPDVPAPVGPHGVRGLRAGRGTLCHNSTRRTGRVQVPGARKEPRPGQR